MGEIMTFRTYRDEDGLLVRYGREVKLLDTALVKAKTLSTHIVEVREFTPRGTEHIVAIFKEGVRIGY